MLTSTEELSILRKCVCIKSPDRPSIRIDALVSPLIPHPGEITSRRSGARLIPVSPAACPLADDMAHDGVEPECENRTEGRCCTEFVGATGRGTVVCAALHPDRALQAANQEPLVALVALQKREKLPPPLH